MSSTNYFEILNWLLTILESIYSLKERCTQILIRVKMISFIETTAKKSTQKIKHFYVFFRNVFNYHYKRFFDS